MADASLEEGLVAYYPFNGNADDESGNGNDGTVSIGHTNWGAGTPVLTSDINGDTDKAYYFNEGGHIEVPYSTILNPASMSLSWWINMEEQANNDYMISMNRWGCYKVNLQDINRVFFTTKVADPDIPGDFIYNDRDHDGDGLVADTWYHLAVSFGGGHMKFYIDGVLVKDWDNVPNTGILDISSTPVNLTFGQDLPTDVYDEDNNVDWGGFFKGTMDEIRIYNRVLTDAEVLTLSERAVSTDATLSVLSVDVGTLDPAFDPATTSYTLEVHADTTAINITATVNDPNATVTGDGEFSTIPGTATVTVTAEDGTTTKDYTIAVSYIVGIDQLSVHSVGLYPNPASQYITVSLNEKYVGSEMIIMDIAGRIVHSEIYQSAKQVVDISGLQSGMYLLKADIDNAHARISFVVE